MEVEGRDLVLYSGSKTRCGGNVCAVLSTLGTSIPGVTAGL